MAKPYSLMLGKYDSSVQRIKSCQEALDRAAIYNTDMPVTREHHNGRTVHWVKNGEVNYDPTKPVKQPKRPSADTIKRQPRLSNAEAIALIQSRVAVDAPMQASDAPWLDASATKAKLAKLKSA